MSKLKADHHRLDTYTRYAEKDMIDLDNEGLRQAPENLPCCLTIKDGGGARDPLNIIVIGPEKEVWPAFIIQDRQLVEAFGGNRKDRRKSYQNISAAVLFRRTLPAAHAHRPDAKSA